jgi:hypothetical protein
MYRCVLKKDDKYYCFEREPSPDLQQALCFESRYDADWTKENEFKDSEVIPVIITDDGDTIIIPTQYLVVSYKPTYFDYCRGCLMNTYSSKHEMKVFVKEDDIVEHIAKLYASIQPLDTVYRHWVLSPDKLFGGYDIDHYGNVPTSLELLIKKRVKQLRK